MFIVSLRYCILFNIFNFYYLLKLVLLLNTFKLFWPILGQRKTSLVVFLWKRRKSSVVFLATILFLMAYIRPLEIILAKKTTELVLLFHKKTTKLVFLWPNMGQLCFKVLTISIRKSYTKIH